jgi:hypothetical protein
MLLFFKRAVAVIEGLLVAFGVWVDGLLANLRALGCRADIFVRLAPKKTVARNSNSRAYNATYATLT